MASTPRIRAIAICLLRHQGRVLVNESFDPVKNLRFCRPLGGGIEFGETGAEAVARELLEEVDAAITDIRFLGVLESIFTHLGQPGHEIVLVYDAVFVDSSLYQRPFLVGKENDGQPFEASWRELGSFGPEVPLYPEGLAQLLRQSSGGALPKEQVPLAGQEPERWNAFYANRAKPCPFFVAHPDESLAGWVREGLLRPGKALDLGCGHGRNAVFLARSGFAVEAVDYSQAAMAWARERAAEAGVDLQLRQQSVFELEPQAGSYDLVYDSGCFHHLPPHRRESYVRLVVDALKPGGWFGLTCFRPEGGSGYTDDEVYARGSLGGGLGYTEERLREIWGRQLELRVVRQMEQHDVNSGLFGEDFLWVLLGRKVNR